VGQAGDGLLQLRVGPFALAETQRRARAMAGGRAGKGGGDVVGARAAICMSVAVETLWSM